MIKCQDCKFWLTMFDYKYGFGICRDEFNKAQVTSFCEKCGDRTIIKQLFTSMYYGCIHAQGKNNESTKDDCGCKHKPQDDVVLINLICSECGGVRKGSNKIPILRCPVCGVLMER